MAGVFTSRDAPPPLPLPPAATVFLTSSRHNGVASKGHVFPANQHSIFRVKLPRCPAKGELLHEGARVNSKPELHLRAYVQVLVRCEKQAVSQVLELRNHCCLSTKQTVASVDWHCIALYGQGSPNVEEQNEGLFSEAAPDTDTDFYTLANLPFISRLINNRVFTRQTVTLLNSHIVWNRIRFETWLDFAFVWTLILASACLSILYQCFHLFLVFVCFLFFWCLVVAGNS